MLLEEPTTLDKTEIHSVLSNNRRSLAIQILSEEGATTLRQLANDIAKIETGEPSPPRSARQSVYVTLHQSHLPKLDTLDIVEYDDASKHVELGPRSDELHAYLDEVERGDTLTTEYQLQVALLGLLTASAAAVDVPVLATLSPGTYAAGTLVVLVVFLAYQRYRDRNVLMASRSERRDEDDGLGY